MHTTRALTILALALLVFAASDESGFAQAVAKRVAVLDLRNEADLSPRDLDYLTDVVRTGARRALPTDRFILMTKENIYDLLPPEKRNLAQCEGQCEVETGRMINADYLVTGAVTKFDKELRITIRLYDIASGNLLATNKAKGLRPRDLEEPVEEIAASLLAPVPGARLPGAATTPPPEPPPPPSPVKPADAPAGMVRIPGGTFTMGCSSGDAECYGDERPAHQVTLNGFWMDATEVTQAQFQSVMGSNPSNFSGCPNCPVEKVTWDEAQSYCQRVGKRLPTEAEWEYAARGGTTGSRYGDINAVAWYTSNSGGKTNPVGQKQPNTYGLYDMLGNVWEWCADWYGETFYSSSPSNSPRGPSSGTNRVLRGGSWNSNPRLVRASHRYRGTPGYRYYNHGFRCVRD